MYNIFSFHPSVTILDHLAGYWIENSTFQISFFVLLGELSGFALHVRDHADFR